MAKKVTRTMKVTKITFHDMGTDKDVCRIIPLTKHEKINPFTFIKSGMIDVSSIVIEDVYVKASLQTADFLDMSQRIGTLDEVSAKEAEESEVNE